MNVVKLGLVVAEISVLERVRPDEGVALVLLRNTLLDMPRTATARRLETRIRTLVPGADIVPYAWHLVTHASDDVLPGRGARTVEGDPRRAGHLADTAEVEAAWEATRRAAAAMHAKHVVLRTPPGFAPGSRGRQRLRRFVHTRPADGPALVWEPEGLWQSEDIDALSAQLGLTVLAPIPASSAPGTELRAVRRWWVHGGGGAPAQLAGGAAEDIADALTEVDDSGPATVVFAGTGALENLRRLRRLLPDP